MKISILGAGNVATQLALVLKKAGHQIVQIYNRSDDAGKELARTVAASFTSDLKTLSGADTYIIAVKDDAIAEIAVAFEIGDKIIAHTSGTKTKDLLENSTSNYGVFYPLQTLTKSAKVDFKDVPILIEGNNKKTSDTLQQLAQSISHNVYQVDEQQRQWVHVAAVFANNFTNHLVAISESILKEHGMKFDILKPLVLRSIESLEKYSPSEIQTGPAARKDFQIIEKHLQLLASDTRLQNIYRILTDSIISTSPKL